MPKDRRRKPRESLDGFLFNVEKFFGSVACQRMSFSEKGVYLVMLFQEWRAGSVPDDAAAVADLIAITESQTAEVAAAWPVVRRKFVARTDDPTWIVNVALEDTRKTQRRWLKDKSRAGHDGAMKRWAGGDPKKRTPHQRLKDARALGTHTAAEWADMCAVYGRCLKCGISAERLYGKQLTKDHIVALHKDGDDTIQNLQPMCRQCNTAKGGDATDYRVGLPETRPEWLHYHITGTPLPLTADLNRSDPNREDGKGGDRRGRKPRAESLTRSTPTSPAILSFPTIGNDGAEWALTEQQLHEWAGLYPGLDVAAEARQALAWVRSSGDHRKTAKGMARFLVNWFNRSVARGGTARRAPDSPTGPSPTARYNLEASEEAEQIILENEARRTGTHGHRG